MSCHQGKKKRRQVRFSAEVTQAEKKMTSGYLSVYLQKSLKLRKR
jgi:hypothetical protein